MESLNDLVLAPLQYIVRDDDHDHDHDEDEDEDTYAEVLTAKLVTMLVMFIVSMICGFAPLVLSKTVKSFSVANVQGDIKKRNPFAPLLAFGGGVLLATTFIHLLPEITHNIEDLIWHGQLTDFEFYLGPLLLCVSFFAMYFIEECVHLYIRSQEKGLQRSLSVRHGDDVEKPGEKMREEESTPHAHSHSHVPQINEKESEVVAFLRGLLIVLALSIHELFEGFAVGLESTAHNVWYMFAAIAAHKLVICFCIGMELLANKTKTYISVIYILLFAVITSIGIGIGILLVGGGGATAAGIYSVVLQGLASGTLVYVIFFELLSRERSGMVQFIGALAGFIVMYCIKLASPHIHSENHGCEDDNGHDHSRN